MGSVSAPENPELRAHNVRESILNEIRLCLSQVSPLIRTVGGQVLLDSVDKTSWDRYLSPCCEYFSSVVKTAKALGIKNSPAESHLLFFRTLTKTVKRGVKFLRDNFLSVDFVALFSLVGATAFQCQFGEDVSLSSDDFEVVLNALKSDIETYLEEQDGQLLVCAMNLEKAKAIQDLDVSSLIDKLRAWRKCGVAEIQCDLNMLRSNIILVLDKGQCDLSGELMKTASELERVLERMRRVVKLNKSLDLLLKVMGTETIVLRRGFGVVDVALSVYAEQQRIELRAVSSIDEELVEAGNFDPHVFLSAVDRIACRDLLDSFVLTDQSSSGNWAKVFVECLRNHVPKDDGSLACVVKNFLLTTIVEFSEAQKRLGFEHSEDEFVVTMEQFIVRLHQFLCWEGVSGNHQLVMRILIHLFNVVIFVMSKFTDPSSKTRLIEVLADNLPPAAFLVQVLNVTKVFKHLEGFGEKVLREPAKVQSDLSGITEKIEEKRIDEAATSVKVLHDHVSIFLDNVDNLVSALRFIESYSVFLEKIGHKVTDFKWNPNEKTHKGLESSMAFISCLHCCHLHFNIPDDSFYIDWILYIFSILQGGNPSSFISRIPFCDFSKIMKDVWREMEFLKVKIHSKVHERPAIDSAACELKSLFEATRTTFVTSFAAGNLSVSHINEKFTRVIDAAREISPDFFAELNRSTPLVITFCRAFGALLTFSADLSAYSGQKCSISGTCFCSVILAIKQYLIEFGECQDIVTKIDEIFEQVPTLFDVSFCEKLSLVIAELEPYVASIPLLDINEAISDFVTASTKELGGDLTVTVPLESKFAILAMNNLICPVPEMQSVYQRFEANYRALEYAKQIGNFASEDLVNSWRKNLDRYLFKFFFVHTKYFMTSWLPRKPLSFSPEEIPLECQQQAMEFSKLTEQIPVNFHRIRSLVNKVASVASDQVNDILQELVVEMSKTMKPLHCDENQMSILESEYKKLAQKVDELNALQEERDVASRDHLISTEEAYRQLQHLSSELYRNLIEDTVLDLTRRSTEREIADMKLECDNLQAYLNDAIDSETRERQEVCERVEDKFRTFQRDLEKKVAGRETMDELQALLAQMNKENEELREEVSRLGAGTHKQKDEINLLLLHERLKRPVKKPKKVSEEENNAIRARIAESARYLEKLRKRLAPQKSDEEELANVNVMRMATIFSSNFDITKGCRFVDSTRERIKQMAAARKGRAKAAEHV